MGHYIYKMPDIGEGVVEAEITAWHVSVGDTVSEEDPIADAMTDKATIELTSPVDGIVTDLGCEAGDMLAVGAMLARIEVEGEVEGEEAAPEVAPISAPIATPSAALTTGGQTSTTEKASTTERPLASPAVRQRAAQAGLDLAGAQASGSAGQVTHVDLDRLSQSLEVQEGETRIKVIGLRRVIATRMQAAKRHIPHFTYVDEIDVTDLEALRQRANEKSTEGKPKLTVLPFIIRALAITLRDWPEFNARYMDEQGYVSQFAALNLGIAAQTDKGLIVPVIKNAGGLSIWQLATEIIRLAQGARDNTLGADELSGASTTLTSLGPLGGIVTTPVINRPEVAIFGPNKIRNKLELRDGEIVERKVMNFSVSCDHRVIDGYAAAAMIADLKTLLQDPQAMFLV